MRSDKMQEELLITQTPEEMVPMTVNTHSSVRFQIHPKPFWDSITPKIEEMLEAEISYLDLQDSCNTLSLNRILRVILGSNQQEELPEGLKPCLSRRRIIKAKFKISSNRVSLGSNPYKWNQTSLWSTKDIKRRSQRVLKSNLNTSSPKTELYARALAKERTHPLQGQFIRTSESKAS